MWGMRARKAMPRVADRVLLFRTHLSGRDLEALGDKDRVVAESAVAARGTRQGAAHLAALDELATVRGHENCGRHEGRAAVGVGNVGELIDEQTQIRSVVPVGASPARGEDAWRPAQHVHRDTGVVGNGSQAGGASQSAGLDEGVLLEGHPILDRGSHVEIAHASHASGLEALPCGGQDGLKLADLVRVGGREDQARAHGRTSTRSMRGASSASFCA